MLHHWYQKRVDSIVLQDGLTLVETTTLKAALRAVSSREQTQSLVAVVDERNQFLGCMSLNSFIAAAVDSDHDIRIKNIPWVAECSSVEISDSILHAMTQFSRRTLELIPVCRSRTFVGFLSAQAVVANIMKFPIRDSSQMSEEINQYVSYVAHDLGNPLTIILLATGLLLQTADRIEHQEKPLKMIQRAARQALRISDDLLQLERYVKLGKIFSQKIRLTDLMEEIYSDNLEFVQFKGARLIVEHCDDIDVALDALLLKRSFLNLIDNASKFSPRHGEIHISARRSSNEHGAIEFSVRDQGQGFDPLQLDQIFEPFLQSGKPLAGYGLGLVIVRRFAELHGGKVWAENCPSGGAMFVLSIPQELQPTVV